MKKLKPKIISSFMGLSSGMAGMMFLSRCGSGCTSCYGCAGTGLALLLLLLGRKFIVKKENKNGMA